MTDQLPVPISRKRAIVKKRTPPQIVVPMLIADAGEQASWRYVEFFTANIRNPNTRRAYARVCGSFLTWCEERGLTLTQIRPHDVGAYICSGAQSKCGGRAIKGGFRRRLTEIGAAV